MNEPLKYFVTQERIRIPAVTREQMTEIDRIAVQETGPNLFQMMENAGRNLAWLIITLIEPEWYEKEIVVLTGIGNNGGGGICAARHLVNHGGKVKLVLQNNRSLREIPSYQKMIYENAGGEILLFNEVNELKPDMIVDAIFGYNFKDSPRGIALNMINWANEKKAKTISLDVPSGVDCNTGETPGEFIKADFTLTLALPKTGLLPNLTGLLYLADIGLPSKVYQKLKLDYLSPFMNETYIKRVFPGF